ncbi:flagellin [Ferroacidibacillus organovorans]|uniref:Flagellin n=1 Tax=Ferroacidibacillus organovorans TaxID=1765683 RepID=A0A101XQH9_9BACL|nr:flagellin [Ferroacidibacillus organovorans]KUO95693.1 hypothetical protein ATW55_13160 [Ferroacidibacillus organovorans]
MNFGINFNSSAQSILNNLSNVNSETSTAYQQLSTGNRINSAANDPAGYAISQQMTSQINGLNQASQNGQNGISLIQTASGGMNQVQSILQSMSTLANEASNAGLTFSNRANLQLEMNSLSAQVNSITNQTQYNGINLLSGQFSSLNTSASGNQLTLQVGADQGQTLSFSINATDVNNLGVAGSALASAADTAGTGTGTNSSITQVTTPASIVTGITTSSNSLLQGGMSLQLVMTASVAAGANSTTAGTITGYSLQLETANGTKIGSAVSLTAGVTSGSTVTIGDTNTGATLQLTLGTLSSLLTVASGNAAGSYTQIDSVSTSGTKSYSGSAANGFQAQNNAIALNVMTQSGAQDAITKIQSAISQLSTYQAQIGAVQDRLNYTVSNLNNASQNLQNAQSTITETNMAQTYTQFSQDQVLQQVGLSMLAQAQQQPGAILKLIQ